jgi:hypothetical protein
MWHLAGPAPRHAPVMTMRIELGFLGTAMMNEISRTSSTHLRAPWHTILVLGIRLSAWSVLDNAALDNALQGLPDPISLSLAAAARRKKSINFMVCIVYFIAYNIVYFVVFRISYMISYMQYMISYACTISCTI